MSSADRSRARGKVATLALIGVAAILASLAMNYLVIWAYPARDISDLPVEGYLISMIAGVAGGAGMLIGGGLLIIALFALPSCFKS